MSSLDPAAARQAALGELTTRPSVVELILLFAVMCTVAVAGVVLALGR